MNTQNMKKLLDFNDILIEPVSSSPIRSRKEINIKYPSGYLPLMTAPMDTVLNNENYKIFDYCNIIPVLPRIKEPKNDFKEGFTSYSLEQFEEKFINDNDCEWGNKTAHVLIDVANGHMSDLIKISSQAKKMYGDRMVLMVGNVANPETFRQYCNIGVDYVRIGIGNGGGCLTTVQTGIGYPMASLIKECCDIKKSIGFETEIVADGGFKTYSDIIKALGLGADYVMLGSIFNKSLESAGETTLSDGEVIDQYSDDAETMFKAGTPLFKTFRGMSTKEVQKEWGNETLKTSEGVVRKHQVEYTLEGWIENFNHYLRSAMSYTGKKELHEFIGGVQFNVISRNAYDRFSK